MGIKLTANDVFCDIGDMITFEKLSGPDDYKISNLDGTINPTIKLTGKFATDYRNSPTTNPYVTNGTNRTLTVQLWGQENEEEEKYVLHSTIEIAPGEKGIFPSELHSYFFIIYEYLIPRTFIRPVMV